MSVLETTRHALCIIGRVTDAITGLPLSGASISLTGGPGAFQTRQATRAAVGAPDQSSTVSAADGSYYFRDLPDGSYTLASAANIGPGRYATANGSAAVARDASGNVVLATANFTLAPTAITGNVTAQATNKPVPFATVALAGGDECVVTDMTGAYQLVAVEPGQRQLVVSAAGFTWQTRTVTATIGTTTSGAAASFTLVAAP
jgi:hypothetical protein